MSGAISTRIKEQALKRLSEYFIGLSEAALAKACEAEELTEVNCNA